MNRCELCEARRSALVMERESVFVALFPRPLKTGHVFVAPCRHVEAIDDLTDAEAAEMGLVARDVAAVLGGLVEAKKVYILAIGDRDSHFHFHLLPRQAGDDPLGRHAIGSEAPWRNTIQPADPAEQVILAERLRGALTK